MILGWIAQTCHKIVCIYVTESQVHSLKNMMKLILMILLRVSGEDGIPGVGETRGAASLV